MIAHYSNTDILFSEYQISDIYEEKELKMKVILKNEMKISDSSNDFMSEDQAKKMFGKKHD